MDVYLFKVNFILAILYLFYRLFFVRDTFFGLRRAMLIGFFFISAILPLADIAWWVEKQFSFSDIRTVYDATLLNEFVASPSISSWSFAEIFSIVYMVGAGLFLVRFLFQMIMIFRLAFNTDKEQVCGITVHRIAENESPFSFFGWIFVNKSSHTAEQLDEIMIHERTHVEQYHSADVIVAELFTVFLWFNPFAWLMKREVRVNLEYLADERVLKYGNDRKTYQYHLLRLSYNKNVATISNNFNVLPLKLRIKMMNRKRTNRMQKAKYLLFIPLAMLLSIAVNIGNNVHAAGLPEFISDAVGNVTLTMPQINKDVAMTPSAEIDNYSTTAKADTVVSDNASSDGNAYAVVDKMPSFVGGYQGLNQFLALNMKYPDNAFKNKVQGKVFVAFVIEKDGSVVEAEVVRSADPELDAEALRVINAMPKWNPGINKGKPVRVKYTLPISFKLNDNDNESVH